MSRVDPARVHALIVGIEAYEAGAAWDLPGPARDAVAFHRLLSAAGVPDAQLRLHLSPLPPFAPEVSYRPADHAALRHVLVRELPQVQDDILWVWWGGHGVRDRAGHTRLFCADATTADKVAIDLDSALIRYSGDAVPGLTEQLWIVDACETFEESLAFRDPLPADVLPTGRRTLVHRQTLLRAAGPGRQAVNDPVRATGLFSEAVIGLLSDRSAMLPGLPDPEELFAAARDRIAALRHTGRTLQQPEIELRTPGRTETLTAGAFVPPERRLSPLSRAVDALLAYPLMADPAERQTVIAALNPAIVATLPRHSKARTDVGGILSALARRRPEALWELYDAVLSFDDDPELGARLAAALGEFAQSYTSRKNMGGRHVQ
ncbi:effector-associated domain 2-containing protein [Streptomyces sp. NPDC002405]|uniref:effector-associated domain 2-containing protein n=1 Tax=Streptomyces sp. NPDC057596 TaxID=3346178 RepID=UPI0036ACC33E